ncbi:PaaI family thioesterase [Methylobacterium sp. 092160098-2]|uniref:Thioesterase superfamily protein n=1 Tax=Methylobacterium oryzae CBMB20 TaxID=693986 RepID=A0A089Q1Q0_9HYPH|nr:MULTISPECIES: PaaI family thioesterase [Methylobacterium]AIQ88514.1 Thioesterase superfamily protein [Methylobacterium oryzae CBMB20]AWV18906.1 thioesterase [Methylobacterium sp. XJLW]MDE4916207.1 PaaI family thioesterase [Methylobacterium sp. 092160098-2]
MTTDTTAFDPAAAGWALVEDKGFIAHVGPLHVRGTDGAYAFRAEQKHANLIGVVHGGMLMSFADRALGETAMQAAGGANCVTIQLEMKFIDVGRLGNWIEIRPQVVKRTGSLVFMRGDVRDDTRLLASADGVWKILRRRPD